MTSTQLSIDPADQDKVEKAVEATEYLAEGAAKGLEALEAAEKTSESHTRLQTSAVQFLGKYKHKQEFIYI